MDRKCVIGSPPSARSSQSLDIERQLPAYSRPRLIVRHTIRGGDEESDDTRTCSQDDSCSGNVLMSLWEAIVIPCFAFFTLLSLFLKARSYILENYCDREQSELSSLAYPILYLLSFASCVIIRWEGRLEEACKRNGDFDTPDNKAMPSRRVRFNRNARRFARSALDILSVALHCIAAFCGSRITELHASNARIIVDDLARPEPSFGIVLGGILCVINYMGVMIGPVLSAGLTFLAVERILKGGTPWAKGMIARWMDRCAGATARATLVDIRIMRGDESGAFKDAASEKEQLRRVEEGIAV